MTTLRVRPAGFLYQKYPSQTDPQPCYVELDGETGVLLVGVDRNIGPGIPARVYNRLCLRWPIPCLTDWAADKALEAISEDAQAILDGFSMVWDGNNMVGRLSSGAVEAEEWISDALSNFAEHDTLRVWSAEEWFAPIGDEQALREELGITPRTTDEQLLDMAKDEHAVAEGAEIEGLFDYLSRVRSQCRPD